MMAGQPQTVNFLHQPVGGYLI